MMRVGDRVRKNVRTESAIFNGLHGRHEAIP